jgi:hypothetical protein
VLYRDPALLGERLDTGGAAELAVAGVLDAPEGGHGLIGDALTNSGAGDVVVPAKETTLQELLGGEKQYQVCPATRPRARDR